MEKANGKHMASGAYRDVGGLRLPIILDPEGHWAFEITWTLGNLCV